jgi:hypothetical protein
VKLFTKWRRPPQSEYFTLEHTNEAAAESWAFARLGDGIEDIQIVDEDERVLASYEELRRRWKIKGA